MFGNPIEFSICLTFFCHIKSISVPYNTEDMPEADFATVGGGGGGTGIRDSLRSLSTERRRRLRKRLLKSEFALLQTLSSKGMCQSSGKKKKVVVLCFRLRQNLNLSTFTLQKRQKNVQKKRDAHARLLFY